MKKNSSKPLMADGKTYLESGIGDQAIVVVVGADKYAETEKLLAVLSERFKVCTHLYPREKGFPQTAFHRNMRRKMQTSFEQVASKFIIAGILTDCSHLAHKALKKASRVFRGLKCAPVMHLADTTTENEILLTCAA